MTNSGPHSPLLAAHFASSFALLHAFHPPFGAHTGICGRPEAGAGEGRYNRLRPVLGSSAPHSGEIAGAGFESAISRLRTLRAARLLHPLSMYTNHSEKVGLRLDVFAPRHYRLPAIGHRAPGRAARERRRPAASYRPRADYPPAILKAAAREPLDNRSVGSFGLLCVLKSISKPKPPAVCAWTGRRPPAIAFPAAGRRAR